MSLSGIRRCLYSEPPRCVSDRRHLLACLLGLSWIPNSRQSKQLAPQIESLPTVFHRIEGVLGNRDQRRETCSYSEISLDYITTLFERNLPGPQHGNPEQCKFCIVHPVERHNH